jgi:beta-D-xylosidase 4
MRLYSRSYAGENGVPSCANSYLLNDVIRSPAGFNRSDVVVGTDCGAVNNMVHANHYASSDLDAAAKTLNGGTDMELGDQTCEWGVSIVHAAPF